MSRRRLTLAILITVVTWFVAVWTPAARAQPQPILILISIDGWRWDYLDRADAPNLKALAARGVRSEALIPSFPTTTFPNHWTIVTGLVPDHHGIVSNTIHDRSIGPTRFTMSSETAKDARWWGGQPIWTTAIRQGRKSASMFWPGSEAIRPTYWKPYDTRVPNADRVRQVLDWLALPEADRPTFVTLYFSAVDSAAHSTGPDSAATLAAAQSIDAEIGRLIAGLTQAKLLDRTTLMAVSDHGLAETSTDRVIALNDYIERAEVEVVDSGAWIALNPGPGLTAEALVARLTGRHRALTVFPKAAAPAWLQYGSHPRVPAVIGLVEVGWMATWVDLAQRAAAQLRRTGGAHGYSTRAREMHGLFVAAGPRVRRGVVVPPIENVHLYSFMCELLGLRPAPNDGDPAATAGLLVR